MRFRYVDRFSLTLFLSFAGGVSFIGLVIDGEKQSRSPMKRTTLISNAARWINNASSNSTAGPTNTPNNQLANLV